MVKDYCKTKLKKYLKQYSLDKYTDKYKNIMGDIVMRMKTYKEEKRSLPVVVSDFGWEKLVLYSPMKKVKKEKRRGGEIATIGIVLICIGAYLLFTPVVLGIVSDSELRGTAEGMAAIFLWPIIGPLLIATACVILTLNATGIINL